MLDTDLALNEKTKNEIKTYFKNNQELVKLKRYTSPLNLPFDVIRSAHHLFKVTSLEKPIDSREGKMKLAECIDSPVSCIVKVRKGQTKDVLATARNEALCSKEYRVNYLLGYQEIVQAQKEQFKSYMFLKKLKAVTLFDFEREAKYLPKISRLRMALSLLNELKTLSNKGINHNDINMSNILVDEYLNVYLIDFGESSRHKPNYLTYGFDFEAIHEIIVEDLELLNGTNLQEAFDAKLEEVGNDDVGYNYIAIDDLIEQVKYQMLGIKRTNEPVIENEAFDMGLAENPNKKHKISLNV